VYSALEAMKNPRSLIRPATFISPLLAGSLAAIATGLVSTRAEDADRTRWYLHFRSGEFNTEWDVLDFWGFSVGLNFDQHWGGEVAGDVWERYVEPDGYGNLGEMSVNAIMPQARFRWPLMDDRLVPYALAGVGTVFYQFNDQQNAGVGRSIESEGWLFGAVAGAGVEYFLADNITFALEGKYVWMEDATIRVDGTDVHEDYSSFLATFGFRIYFDENHPRPFAEQEEEVPSRFSLGIRYGGSVLTDDQLAPGVSLEPEASAYWDTLNQYPSLTLGWNWGEHWGVDFLLGGGEQRIVLDGVGSVAEYAVVTGMPQLRYRWPLLGGQWVPYASVGAGLTYAEINDANIGPGVSNVGGSGFQPVIMVGGGLEYFVTRNFSLTTDLWWLHTWDHSVTINDVEYSGDFSTIQLQIGFRAYLFD
jgi:opacity protein-like surface antigen